jgi:hypothetical protein
MAEAQRTAESAPLKTLSEWRAPFDVAVCCLSGSTLCRLSARNKALSPTLSCQGTSEQAVIRAKAGIQFYYHLLKRLDSSLR